MWSGLLTTTLQDVVRLLLETMNYCQICERHRILRVNKHRTHIYMAKLTGEDFGPRDIPVYETIRGILRDYPDGQIFKVLNNICH